MRPLNPREKTLLMFCFAAFFIMGNLIGGQYVIRGLSKSSIALKQLKNEKMEQDTWLPEEEDAARRAMWIDKHMPSLTSIGKDQGELLEKLQTEAFDRKLNLERQNLLESKATEFYHEVSVNLIIRGELVKINEWLTTLQKPEDFYVIKTLEFALDTRSREKEPQARCNITVARWFKL